MGPRRARVLHALLATLLALVAAAALAGAARADVGEEIIRRCTHNESLSGFSQSDYRKALKELSAGTEEYSNCAQLIRQAELAAANHGGGAGPAAPGPAAAGAVAPSPAEQRAIASAPKLGSAPVQVGGQTIHPGVVHADIASALSTLPTPLLATLAFVLVCLLVATGAGIRNRVRRVRRSG